MAKRQLATQVSPIRVITLNGTVPLPQCSKGTSHTGSPQGLLTPY